MMVSDAKKHIKALTFLAALYPKFTLTEATIKAYNVILGDLPADLVEKAAMDLGARSTWFPSAADLRKAAFDLQAVGAGRLSSYDAWAQIKALEFKRPADYESSLDPLVLKTINALGGITAYMMANTEHEMSWRNRFIAAYDQFLARERTEWDRLPAITSWLDRQALETGEPNIRKQIQDYIQTNEAMHKLADQLSGVADD